MKIREILSTIQSLLLSERCYDPVIFNQFIEYPSGINPLSAQSPSDSIKIGISTVRVSDIVNGARKEIEKFDEFLEEGARIFDALDEGLRGNEDDIIEFITQLNFYYHQRNRE